MGKSFNKTVIIVIGVFLALIISAAAFTTQNPSKIVQNPTPTIVSEEVPEQKAEVSYSGQEGKDALTLLKNIANVEQNSSGLVTGIDGREATESKKEFWAFYVNGQMSSVGPAEYQTKNADKIEWKIENY